MTSSENLKNPNEEVTVWDPYVKLRAVDPLNIKYSKGFLRALPQEWFPGLSSHWFPLAHSLGVDLEILEIKPMISPPGHSGNTFFSRTGDDFIGLMFDQESAEVVASTIVPSVVGDSKDVLLNYISRRLFTSIGQAWSGVEKPFPVFDSNYTPEASEIVGAIKLFGTLNSSHFTCWILLSQNMCDILDSLWRKQLKSSQTVQMDSCIAEIEIGHLAVNPANLTSYLTSGASIDLEMSVNDQATLLVDRQAWGRVRMLQVDGKFALEAQTGSQKVTQIPEGFTKLCITMGSVNIESGELLEIAQPGAIIETGIQLSDTVNLVINGEKVGEAFLKVYQGNFVIQTK